MRKNYVFLLVFLAIVVNTVSASNDTVRYGDSCYLYNELEAPLAPWPYENDTLACHIYFEGYNGGLETYQNAKLYVAKDWVQVYGVAATMIPSPEDDTVTSWYTAYLFQYTGNQFILVDSSAAWSQKNVFLYTAVGYGRTYNTYVPSYEFYFSQPHTVTDSFAISIKRKIKGISNDPGVYCLAKGVTNYPERGEMFFFNDRFKSMYEWGKFFAILQPERIGCEAAAAEVADRGDDYAVLEWAMGGDSCQLSVAPYDMLIDSGLVVDLTANSYTATGLDTGVYYAARLRTQCHHSCHIHADTVVWSDWGAPTMFYLGSEEPDTTGIGIRRVEAPVEFSVTPNPARGLATVRCAAGLRGVEVVSATGATVLSLDGGGAQACVLDLAGLAKGGYVVRIATPQGTAAQKLVVE